MSEHDVQSTYKEHLDRHQDEADRLLNVIDEASWVLFVSVREFRDVLQDLERVRGLLAKS